MQLGIGYWSLPSIERRIANLEERKPRRWQKRLKVLRRYRKQILESADQSRMVKGWKGRRARQERYRKIRAMLQNQTLASVGGKLGISRQRVHQIVRQWK